MAAVVSATSAQPHPERHLRLEPERPLRLIDDRLPLLWLRRHGYLDERAAEERSDEAVVPSALDACTQLALAGGAFLARSFEHKDNPDAAFERRSDASPRRAMGTTCIARCASPRMTIGARERKMRALSTITDPKAVRRILARAPASRRRRAESL
jgi:hypothetical protein